MSKREYKMMYVALSQQQIESGEFSLFRLIDGRRQQKKWSIGREARFLRYDSGEWIVEMSGSDAPDAAWFLCPVIGGWTDIDRAGQRADGQDLQQIIDAHATMAEADVVQGATRNTDHAATPFVETNHWRVNPNLAEPDFNFTPTRMNVDGGLGTFEQLQDFVDRVRQAPRNPDIWQGIPGPQANVTATEEGVRLQHTGRRLPMLPMNWQRDVRAIDVNEALRRHDAMVHHIPGAVLDHAIEMARADRAERQQATHRWEQDAEGNWHRNRITEG